MPRLSLAGFDRTSEMRVRTLFQSLDLPEWTVAEESAADVILVDLDSIYGQMAWMRGFDDTKVTIGLTEALRADTMYRLAAPPTADAFKAVLQTITNALGGGVAGDADEAAALRSPPAPRARRPPDPPDTPGNVRLAARIASNPGPFIVQWGDLPRLVVDPERQQFAPGHTLKDLLGYAVAELPEAAITAIDRETVSAALDRSGGAHPLERLRWVLALGANGGLRLEHGPESRFQLCHWPRVEREFPRHFKIATVLLRQPGTVSEVAAASGTSEAEVADYVTAALALGHAIKVSSPANRPRLA
jgi:hypothetical protein